MRNPYRKLSKLNIQPEKGTRRIANDLFVALTMADLSGVEYKLINVIISETWGYQRQSVILTFKEFEIFCNVSHSAVIRNIKILELKQVIIINRQLVADRLPINEYSINKYYDTWQAVTSSRPATPTGSPLYTSLQLQLVAQITKTGSQNALKLVADRLPPAYSIKKEKKEKGQSSLKSSRLPGDNGKENQPANEGQTELDNFGKKYAKKNKLKTVLDEQEKQPDQPNDGIFS